MLFDIFYASDLHDLITMYRHSTYREFSALEINNISKPSLLPPHRGLTHDCKTGGKEIIIISHRGI